MYTLRVLQPSSILQKIIFLSQRAPPFFTYEKVLLHNYIKMTKVVSSIFGEDKQIKAFELCCRIGNNFVM